MHNYCTRTGEHIDLITWQIVLFYMIFISILYIWKFDIYLATKYVEICFTFKSIYHLPALF